MAINVKLNTNPTMSIVTSSENNIHVRKDSVVYHHYLENLIHHEAEIRTEEDARLQAEIDEIVGGSTVSDVVECYDRGTTSKTDLVHYDTSKLKNNNIITVIEDETNSGVTSFYRWIVRGEDRHWNLIGKVDSYTKTQVDEKIAGVMSIIGQVPSGKTVMSIINENKQEMLEALSAKVDKNLSTYTSISNPELNESKSLRVYVDKNGVEHFAQLSDLGYWVFKEN